MFRNKKSVEEHYKGTNKQESVRGNSKEHVNSVKSKALKKKRGNYSIFKYEGGDTSKATRIKHNLSHSEMSHELKNNPKYRGTDTHGFGGRRTYKSVKVTHKKFGDDMSGFVRGHRG